MLKYVTPFNLIALCLVGLGLYGVLNPGPWGYGVLAIFYLVPIAFLAFGLDFIIGKFTTQRKKIVFEFIIIGLFYLGYEYSQRTKTFIIPDNPDFEFLITVYGLENTNELPTSIFTLDYSYEVPNNGIILTSSSKLVDLPKTKIQTSSGIKLNDKTDKNDLCFGEIRGGVIKCGKSSFNYAVWKIDNGGAISYSSTDLKELNIKLTKLICNGLK